MLPAVERTQEQLTEALLVRMENLASDLMMLSSITRRGAILPKTYREETVPAIRRLTLRVLNALEKGEPAASVLNWETTDAT